MIEVETSLSGWPWSGGRSDVKLTLRLCQVEGQLVGLPGPTVQF